ncbi:hypothetical protein MBLNU230_g8504t2 [Neophaeotheca triangularis]
MRSLLLGAAVAALSPLVYGRPTLDKQQNVEARQTDEYEAYFFVYFTADTLEGETISFATSQGNDALRWNELNNGTPYLNSTQGTGGARDPFIIREPGTNKVYLIATDLSIGSGTSWGDAVTNGSRYLNVWETEDLVNWSEQRQVLVSPPTAGNTWAPEAFYDDANEEFVVFWASQLYNESDTNRTNTESYARMLYATTNDFVTFSEAQIWQDGGSPEAARIDSTVYQDPGSAVYHRFTKYEGGLEGCVDLVHETSTNLRGNLDEWTVVESCIGQNAGLEELEGPDAFRTNPGDVNGDLYVLFVDEFIEGSYIPLVTEDINNPNWTVAEDSALPTSPRHGSVIPITAAELERLNALGAPESVLGDYLHADPTIAAYCGRYYIYATTDGFEGWGGQEFYVWSSDDLVDWTRSEEPFLTLNGTDGNVPWATGNAWAPTIAEKNGMYYFYFSGENPTYEQKTIGVAVAPSPSGPFEAQPTAMITNTEEPISGQAIDPAVFQDPADGKYYIFWGNGDSSLEAARYAELTDDMLNIVNGTIRRIDGLDDFREGIWVNYREPYYHITFSIDSTNSPDYRVGYSISESIHGPWEFQGVVLRSRPSQGIYGAGHNSIVNVPGTDDWYIAYHRFDIPDGNGTNREVMVDPIYFDEAGLLQEVNPSWNGVQIPQTYEADCPGSNEGGQGGGKGSGRGEDKGKGKGHGKGHGKGKGSCPNKGNGNGHA